MRVLRMKHENVRQNITYNCEAGADDFFNINLQAANGETINFEGKSVRMVSQVSTHLFNTHMHACTQSNLWTKADNILLSLSPTSAW